MGPVDMSAFKLGEPIGIDGDVFRNYRYQDKSRTPIGPPLLPLWAGQAAAAAATRFPLSGGIINSPVAMGTQGLMLGAAIQKNDPEYQRRVANFLLTARAVSLAESIRVGLAEANSSLFAASEKLRNTPVHLIFGAKSVSNYRATMAALKTSLLRGPARNLGALIAVGAARAILTDPVE
jgi:hypothetical protein